MGSHQDCREDVREVLSSIFAKILRLQKSYVVVHCPGGEWMFLRFLVVFSAHARVIFWELQCNGLRFYSRVRLRLRYDMLVRHLPPVEESHQHHFLYWFWLPHFLLRNVTFTATPRGHLLCCGIEMLHPSLLTHNYAIEEVWVTVIPFSIFWPAEMRLSSCL